MPSLKGLAVGVGAVIVVGYLALRTGAAKGLEGLATGITKTIASPLVGIGGGLKILGEGVSTFLSPTIAPTIAPKFDWSGWQPFGPGNGGDLPPGFGPGDGNGREEDRNGGGGGVRTYPVPKLITRPSITPQIAPRPEDRPVSRIGGMGTRAFIR